MFTVLRFLSFFLFCVVCFHHEGVQRRYERSPIDDETVVIFFFFFLTTQATRDLYFFFFLVRLRGAPEDVCTIRVSAKVYRGVLWYAPIFFPEKFGFLQGFGVYQSTPREKWGFRGCR